MQKARSRDQYPRHRLFAFEETDTSLQTCALQFQPAGLAAVHRLGGAVLSVIVYVACARVGRLEGSVTLCFATAAIAALTKLIKNWFDVGPAMPTFFRLALTTVAVKSLLPNFPHDPLLRPGVYAVGTGGLIVRPIIYKRKLFDRFA